MPYASGSRVSMSYIEETTRGTTPGGGSPTMQAMRIKSFNVNPAKDLLESEEIRADRETPTVRHGQKRADGSIATDFILGNADDWIRVALGGTWEAVTNANNIGITNPDQVVCSSNSLLTDGFRPGDIVTLSGLAVSGENGDYRVTAAAAGALTLRNLDGTAPNLTAETEGAGPGVDLKGSRCSIGTNLKSFSVERALEDIAEFIVFKGVGIASMGISVSPTEIPELSFDVIGMDFDAPSGTSIDSTPTAAPTNDSMAPIDGAIWEGGSKVGTITAFQLTAGSGRSLESVIGATSSPDLFDGPANNTGSLSALVEDSVLLTKFTAETATKVWLRLVDPTDPTEFINIVMNNVLYTGAPINPPRTGAVVMDLPFRAKRDTTTGVSLSIQRSNA